MENCVCLKCGHAIPANSKFCLNCGAPILAEKAPDAAVSEASIPNDSATKFLIAGRQLVFSADVIEYNNLRVLFSNKASDLELEYKVFYKNREHNFRDLFDVEIPELVKKVIQSIQFGVRILMKYGVDYIDENELASMVSRRKSIQDYLSSIFEKAEKIEDYANELAGYRAVSRASRGYWEGGGFGLSGAIKGALTAGALNMGTNMFRGIGDSITNANDRAKINQLKKELANCDETYECLLNTVYVCCLSVFYCVKEVLEGNNLIPHISFDYKRASSRAKNYLELYTQSGKSPEMYEKVIDVLCESIQSSPYSASLYGALYQILNGEKQDIHALAKHFGVQRDYKKLIIAADQKRLQAVLALQENSIPEIDQKLEKLSLLTKENPYLDVSKHITSLKSNRKRLQELNQNKQETQSLVLLISEKRKPLIDALNTNNMEFLWNEIQNNNLFAKYELKLHYYILTKPLYRDRWYEVDRVLKDIASRAEQGNTFAQYLKMYFEYTTLRNKSWSNQHDYDKPTLKKIYLCVKELAQNGNILAQSDVGYWMNAYYYSSDNEGVRYLLAAAKSLDPFALYNLGIGYKEGRWGLPKDKSKAENYLKLASAFDFPDAKKELDNLVNPSNSASSSCFITSATCLSLGKGDNCYELNTFRHFRDNWLRNCADGTQLIKEYYNIAPKIVSNIDKREDHLQIYEYIWNSYLKRCLNAIEAGDNDYCKKLYCEMVYTLKERYGT